MMKPNVARKSQRRPVPTPTMKSKKVPSLGKENSVLMKSSSKPMTAKASAKKLPQQHQQSEKKPAFQDKLMQIKQSLASTLQAQNARKATIIQRWFRRVLRRMRLNSNKQKLAGKATPHDQFEYKDGGVGSFNVFARLGKDHIPAKPEPLSVPVAEKPAAVSQSPILSSHPQPKLNEDLKEVMVSPKPTKTEATAPVPVEIKQTEQESRDPKPDQLNEFLKQLAEADSQSSRSMSPAASVSAAATEPSQIVPADAPCKSTEHSSTEQVPVSAPISQPTATEPVSTARFSESASDLAPVKAGTEPAATQRSEVQSTEEPHFEKLANYLEQVAAENRAAEPVSRVDSVRDTAKESVELAEAYKTVEALKQALDAEKAKAAARVAEVDKKAQADLQKQKKDLEQIVERNLGFIDQLVKDKRELTELCETLKTKTKEEESKSAKRIKEVEQGYAVELKKNKEAWMAAEKLRKEKWEREKTQEIKVNTTKALQPELVSIMQKHQRQMQQLEEELGLKYKKERELHIAETEEKTKELRERHRRELEEAVENERQNCEAKLKQQYDRLERAHDDAKTRGKLETQAEIERLEFQRKSEREKFDRELADLRKQSDAKTDATKAYYEERMEELQKRQKSEAKRIKDELNAENEAWKETLQAQKAAEVQKIAAELKAQMEMQRKQEVDMVISKLGDESHEYKKQMAKERDVKVAEAEARNLAQIEELRKTTDDWIAKYKSLTQTKEMLDENLQVLTRNMENMQRGMEEKDKKYRAMEAAAEDSKRRMGGIDAEYKKIVQEAESDYRKEKMNLEKEVARLTEELDIAKKRAESEVAAMKQKSAKELELIEDRVKKALGKKDEGIRQLKNEVAVLTGQLEKYKELLARQRQEMLSK